MVIQTSAIRVRSKRQAASRGFSLLELMLVIAIMGILMAVVALNVGTAGNKAKVRATQQSLKTIQQALDSYHLEFSAYPPDLRTLITTKVLKDMKLQDGWGADFFYDIRPAGTDQPYSLFSSGEDKVVGNADDINVWLLNK